MSTISLLRTLAQAQIMWLLSFEALKTVLWFSRAWVASPANWIADRKMRPFGIEPDWGINSLQYLFLPILPIVTLGMGTTLYYIITKTTGDVYLAAGILSFSYIYASGGIHLDGFVDTLDALNCHDKDKWQVMKEPHIGALGAYNLNLFQVFFSAGMFYLGIMMKEAPWLVVLLSMSFVMARLNLLYLVPKAIKQNLFRADEIVHIEPPYTETMRKFSHTVFTTNFRYAFGLLILSLCVLIALMFGATQLHTPLTQIVFTLVVLFFVNEVIVKRAVQNLGFISGDVFGYSLSVIEAMCLFLTLVSYKANLY